MHHIIKCKIILVLAYQFKNCSDLTFAMQAGSGVCLRITSYLHDFISHISKRGTHIRNSGGFSDATLAIYCNFYHFSFLPACYFGNLRYTPYLTLFCCLDLSSERPCRQSKMPCSPVESKASVFVNQNEIVPCHIELLYKAGRCLNRLSCVRISTSGDGGSYDPETVKISGLGVGHPGIDALEPSKCTAQ